MQAIRQQFSIRIMMRRRECSDCNAKELDNETGLYYYGARYLDPTGAMWLSVDPVFHAGTSPYVYCLGNPEKLVDSDGRVECKEDGTVDVDFEADQF